METKPDEFISIPGEGQLINRGPQSVTEYYCTPDEKLRAGDGWQHARGMVPARHPKTINAGVHVIHTGGKYDSHLLIPVVPRKG